MIDFAVIAEELGRKSYDFLGAYGTCVFNGLNILHNGTEAQRAHWLPRLLDGRIKMSISMTEPGAGSDAGAMRTSARRDGEHWVINGQKVFSTAAGAERNVINLYARSKPEGPHQEALSLFLVDKDTPGITLRKLDTLGRRALGTYEVFFDDVRVSADRLVGEPHKGWAYMLSGLQLERVSIVSLVTTSTNEHRPEFLPFPGVPALNHNNAVQITNLSTYLPPISLYTLVLVIEALFNLYISITSNPFNCLNLSLR